MSERKCLRRNNPGHVCQGAVTGRPSHAGTGTMIYECQAAQRASQEWADRIRNDYPDSPIAPAWFDPTYAGESWDEEY